jgi:hypothetical protein
VANIKLDVCELNPFPGKGLGLFNRRLLKSEIGQITWQMLEPQKNELNYRAGMEWKGNKKKQKSIP